MDFANAIKEEGKFIRTENGAVALNTTSDARRLQGRGWGTVHFVQRRNGRFVEAGRKKQRKWCSESV